MSNLINPHTGQPMASVNVESEHHTMWVFDPQEDVQVNELALVLRFLMQALGVSLAEVAFNDLPEPLQKHFTSVDFLVDADGKRHMLPEAKNG